MKKYKAGLLSGVFDLFHIGHLNIIKRAKSYCDYLIIGVNSDQLCLWYKGKMPVIPTEERVEILKSITYVDEVVVLDSLSKLSCWNDRKFDVYFHGNDLENDESYMDIVRQLKAVGVDTIFLPYTDGVSSSQIKKKIQKAPIINYRSILDMTQLIKKKIVEIPMDCDFVVGIPRSGLIPATIIATIMNLPMVPIEVLLDNTVRNTTINSKKWKKEIDLNEKKTWKVLLVEDSVNHGNSITIAKRKLEESPFSLTVFVMCIYGTQYSSDYVDCVFEVCPQPRFFEWNIQHSNILKHALVDSSVIVDAEKKLRFSMLKKVCSIFIFDNNEDVVLNTLNKYGVLVEQLIVIRKERSFDDLVHEFMQDKYQIAIVSNRDIAQRLFINTGKPVLDINTGIILQ